MKGTCPHCQYQGEIAAFLNGDDWKRLAAVMADIPADCGRAVYGYLRLFKPPKTGLRPVKATRLASEVRDLVLSGYVCIDERSGVRRETTPAMWAAGIEEMLSKRDALQLPLGSHGYLRKVVFGIADSVDAQAEKQRDKDLKHGRRSSTDAGMTGTKAFNLREAKLDRASFMDMKDKGVIDQATCDARVAEVDALIASLIGSE